MTMPDSTAQAAKGQGEYGGAGNGQVPGLSLQVAAAAQLATTMGRVADELAAERQRHALINQAIHPFMIPPNGITIVSNAGTLNQPNLYGPQLGNYWDVKRISVSGITAGTITVYLNAVGGEILAVLTSSGANTPLPLYPGGSTILLGGNDAMVFSAAGITGSPVVSVAGIEVAAEWIGDYLL